MKRHAFVVGVIVGTVLLLVVAAAALADEAVQVAAAGPQDPLAMIITGALQLAQSTPGGVLALFGGAYFAGPNLTKRLGLGTDPAVLQQLARHDERSRETRREVRYLRRTVHWQAQVLTALALKAGVPVPAPPVEPDDPDSDEDAPKADP